ncbi:MAG: helix-turn-helix domain-containing protein [Clostridia bacterium]|nr:helix-turn-helix domain-containing protein [Clostridia bacterium]
MDKTFCTNLKSARNERGMTQKEVAGSLCVVESCYANWEQGRTEPNVEMLRKLCAILEVTADELINGNI